MALDGDLFALLHIADVPGAAPPSATEFDSVLNLFVSSVKAGPRAEPLAFLLPYRTDARATAARIRSAVARSGKTVAVMAGSRAPP